MPASKVITTPWNQAKLIAMLGLFGLVVAVGMVVCIRLLVGDEVGWLVAVGFGVGIVTSALGACVFGLDKIGVKIALPQPQQQK